jgi:hypothetical protein
MSDVDSSSASSYMHTRAQWYTCNLYDRLVALGSSIRPDPHVTASGSLVVAVVSGSERLDIRRLL